MTGKDPLAGAARAAAYSMGLQLMLKVTTFLLNAFVLRFISRDMLGIVNVRLLLLYSTTLFLTSEGFRKACLSKSQRRNWQQVVNLIWLTLPIAVMCGGFLGMVWLYFLEVPDPTVVPYYGVGVVCYAMSAVIEMLCETMFVLGQVFLFVRLKVVTLGCSELIKSVIIVCLVSKFPALGLLSFAIAQVVGVSAYVTMYYVYFTFYLKKTQKKEDDFPVRSMSQFLPAAIPDEPFIDGQLAKLTWSFLKQSFFKQILTEGEKFVMTFFAVLSFADQGVYDVINNLGSLVARLLFLPIEESSYLFYSQTLVRGQGTDRIAPETISMCSQVLSSVLKTVTLVGMVILVFGHSFAFLALDLYGGIILSAGAGPTLLRWYCLYVLFIAINGSTEGFVFAAMSREDVDRYNHKMLVFSGLFLGSSWLLTKLLGSVGFILANCLNMTARITHSVYFISQYFKSSSHKPLREALPSIPVLVSLAVSFIITFFSEKTYCCDKGLSGRLTHIAIGAGCLTIVALCILLTEKKLVAFVKEQYNLRRKGPQDKKSS